MMTKALILRLIYGVSKLKSAIHYLRCLIMKANFHDKINVNIFRWSKQHHTINKCENYVNQIYTLRL